MDTVIGYRKWIVEIIGGPAADLCPLSLEMDELRKERKILTERRWYLKTADAKGAYVEEAAEVQQRITDIDAKVAALYA